MAKQKAREQAVQAAVTQAKAKTPQKSAKGGKSQPPPWPAKPPKEEPAGQEPQLTKVVQKVSTTEIERVGYERFYPESFGFKVLPFAGLRGRTEIVQQARPTDAYIIDAKQRQFTDEGNLKGRIYQEYRRSGAGTAVFHPGEGYPEFRYTFDYREIFHALQGLYGHLKEEDQQTNEVLVEYRWPTIPGWGDLNTLWGYKRVKLSSPTDTGTSEDLDEILYEATLTPLWNQNMDLYYGGKFGWGKKRNQLLKPKSRLHRTELRLRFPEWKLSLTPGFSYSETAYHPTEDHYIKREIYFDVGKDFTPKFRGSSKLLLALADTDSRGAFGVSGINARAMEWKSKLSYEALKDIYLKQGLNFGWGLGGDDADRAYDNFGWVSEIEYYKPGFLRSVFGTELTSYYSLSKVLYAFYWKLFAFEQ